MKRHALQVAFAALLGALAIFVLPALAGAKGDDHSRSDDSGHHGRHHHNHHGVFDRDEDTGTISAFDASSGKLTIALFGGESVSGLVGSRTDIRCGFGDNGRGEPEPGDDHGGRGFEPGDDRGDHGNGRPCSTTDLTVGAVVHEADLELERGIARFDEIELDRAA